MNNGAYTDSHTQILTLYIYCAILNDNQITQRIFFYQCIIHRDECGVIYETITCNGQQLGTIGQLHLSTNQFPLHTNIYIHLIVCLKCCQK